MVVSNDVLGVLGKLNDVSNLIPNAVTLTLPQEAYPMSSANFNSGVSIKL